jgi:hypothetical protein
MLQVKLHTASFDAQWSARSMFRLQENTDTGASVQGNEIVPFSKDDPAIVAAEPAFEKWWSRTAEAQEKDYKDIASKNLLVTTSSGRSIDDLLYIVSRANQLLKSPDGLDGTNEHAEISAAQNPFYHILVITDKTQFLDSEGKTDKKQLDKLKQYYSCIIEYEDFNHGVDNYKNAIPAQTDAHERVVSNIVGILTDLVCNRINSQANDTIVTREQITILDPLSRLQKIVNLILNNLSQTDLRVGAAKESYIAYRDTVIKFMQKL